MIPKNTGTRVHSGDDLPEDVPPDTFPPEFMDCLEGLMNSSEFLNSGDVLAALHCLQFLDSGDVLAALHCLQQVSFNADEAIARIHRHLREP